jgi:hypothetical protein
VVVNWAKERSRYLLNLLAAFGGACDPNLFARAHIVIEDTILQTHIAAI